MRRTPQRGVQALTYGGRFLQRGERCPWLTPWKCVHLSTLLQELGKMSTGDSELSEKVHTKPLLWEIRVIRGSWDSQRERSQRNFTKEKKLCLLTLFLYSAVRTLLM